MPRFATGQATSGRQISRQRVSPAPPGPRPLASLGVYHLRTEIWGRKLRARYGEPRSQLIAGVLDLTVFQCVSATLLLTVTTAWRASGLQNLTSAPPLAGPTGAKAV